MACFCHPYSRVWVFLVSHGELEWLPRVLYIQECRYCQCPKLNWNGHLESDNSWVRVLSVSHGQLEWSPRPIFTHVWGCFQCLMVNGNGTPIYPRVCMLPVSHGKQELLPRALYIQECRYCQCPKLNGNSHLESDTFRSEGIASVPGSLVWLPKALYHGCHVSNQSWCRCTWQFSGRSRISHGGVWTW